MYDNNYYKNTLRSLHKKLCSPWTSGYVRNKKTKAMY